MPTTFPSPDEATPHRVVACVTCIVFNDDQTHILLHKRDDANLWSLPGGAIDPGETAAQAAARETLEETTLTVTPTALLAIDSNPNHGNVVHYQDGNINQNTALVILCTPTNPIPATWTSNAHLSPDSHEARFFPLQNLPQNLAPPHAHRLRKLAKNPNPPQAELD